MNRKDFFKSLIVGAAILPTLTKVSAKEAEIPSIVSPDVDALFIKCDSIQIDYEYNHGINIETYLGAPNRLLTGKRITLNGINKSEFNSLDIAMGKARTERTFLIGSDQNKSLITGFMTHLDYNGFSDDVTCEIQYTKP